MLTLARIGRTDLLGSFTVPVRIVDQVRYEITKPENDPKGEVAAALARLHNQIEIVETNVGVGYQTRRARNPREPSATWRDRCGRIRHDFGAERRPRFCAARAFRRPRCDGLADCAAPRTNTAAWLLTLHREGLLPEGLELVEKINTGRATPLVPFEKVGLTKRVRSSWLRRSFGR